MTVLNQLKATIATGVLLMKTVLDSQPFRHSSHFLLGLKEERKLTQTGLQGVIEGVTTLSRSHLSALRAELCSTLNAAGVSPSSISRLNELFDSDGPFGRHFLGWEPRIEPWGAFELTWVVRDSYPSTISS